ncbi:hypothetical protein X947_5738 [Burkholderia pseudomallei MSHR7334]|nr:hypothetical protein X947_5738 [Burkholderia pseudomallei MSHR7334]
MFWMASARSLPLICALDAPARGRRSILDSSPDAAAARRLP